MRGNDVVSSGWRVRLAALAAFGLWFWLVYGLCDVIAAHADHYHDVRIAMDGRLPFVPAFAFAYLLINPLLAAPAILLRDVAKAIALYATLAVEVAVAGLVFILFPVAPMNYPTAAAPAAMRLADAVNLTYNLFPSLHVALALSCGMALSGDLRGPPKLLLWLLVAAIVLSTLLTKQHYVADVAAGSALALATMRFCYPRFTARWTS